MGTDIPLVKVMLNDTVPLTVGGWGLGGGEGGGRARPGLRQLRHSDQRLQVQGLNCGLVSQ